MTSKRWAVIERESGEPKQRVWKRGCRAYCETHLNQSIRNLLSKPPAIREEALCRLLKAAKLDDEETTKHVRDIVREGGDTELWNGILKNALWMRHTVGARLSDTIAKHEAFLGKVVYVHAIGPRIVLEKRKELDGLGELLRDSGKRRTHET